MEIWQTGVNWTAVDNRGCRLGVWAAVSLDYALSVRIA